MPPAGLGRGSPLARLVAVTGVHVDVPAGRVSHPSSTSPVLGAFTLRGVRAGDRSLTVVVAADGTVTLS